MNAYKYIGFLDESTRPLTIFEYYRCKKLSEQQAQFNNNLSTIIDHVNSMGNKLQKGRDYIICNDSEMAKLQKRVSNKKYYQYYDSIISVPSIRKAVHEQFRRDINSNSKIKSYLEKINSL
ncbi:GTPase involved in cell partitioning and DNA repair [Providencia alcalifaciens]|nr:GTPase involved in cell partitioning and DNA repair [Providencia alcalifaciens]